MDIRSTLLHFALINYSVPIERLRPHLPSERFDIVPFSIGGRRCGLLSVVPFLDDDFRFVKIAPFLKFRFAQTNHRLYVIDRKSGEHVVWFFGTTLGSRVVHLARGLWRIPWHYARYQWDCTFDESVGRYTTYRWQIMSPWSSGEIELEDTGRPAGTVDGFDSLQQMQLILTHPVEGFFRRLDGRLGTYSVWHDEISLRIAHPRLLYFSLYERLNIMTREEMSRPHSVFLCPSVVFDVHMPPRKVS